MVLAFLGFDRGNRILMFCMCSKLPVWQRVLTVVVSFNAKPEIDNGVQ